MLSNTPRLNFSNLKIIHIFHQRYHPKVIGHILKNEQKNKCVCILEIIRLIILKMKMKMKKRSHKFDINRRKHRYSKYKKCFNTMLLICINQHVRII